MKEPLKPVTYLVWCLILFCALSIPANAQEKELIQVKAFDQQLNPIPNLRITINDTDAVTTNNKGIGFLELQEKDLPPKTVKIERDGFEAESWNYSKGILEIIVRAKNFNTVLFHVVTPDKKPLRNITVTFYGNEVITASTNDKGVVEFQVPVRQKLTNKQFSIKAYHILELSTQGKEKTIVAEPVKANPVNNDNEPKFFENYDIQNIDSIQSLTAFYAIFKDYPIASLDDNMKKRIDAKFNELVQKLGHQENFIGKISDSSLVSSDIQSLQQQALAENINLDQWRKQFEDKIKIINKKLENGVDSLDEEARKSLLLELNELERILEQNEKKFYKNLTDYQSVLRSLKEKLVAVKDLHDKLYLSESQREAEKILFQRRLSIIVILTATFSLLAIIFIYFSARLKRKQQQLIKANSQMKSLTDSLEGIVEQRTKLLQQANDEMAQFLYRASHDLKGPVASILGLCNISLHLADPHSRELFEKTSQAALRMEKILKKLALINEISHPGVVSSFNLEEKIKRVVSSHELFIKEHHVTIEMDLESGLMMQSYPKLIDITIVNILENALFYSGLKDQPTIKISCRLKDGIVTLRIYDNGIGIDPESIQSIWNMFYIGDERSKGNGLGLYVTYKAVRTLGGTIEAKSEKDSFTEFAITLPQNIVPEK